MKYWALIILGYLHPSELTPLPLATSNSQTRKPQGRDGFADSPKFLIVAEITPASTLIPRGLSYKVRQD